MKSEFRAAGNGHTALRMAASDAFEKLRRAIGGDAPSRAQVDENVARRQVQDLQRTIHVESPREPGSSRLDYIKKLISGR